MLPSELTNTIELFIGMKHISPTFRYIMPMYLRLTTFTKHLPQMSFHLFVCDFFRSGTPIITLMTVGALTVLQLPARQLQTCARLMQGWMESAGCPPPKEKSWLRRCIYRQNTHGILLQNITTDLGQFWDDFRKKKKKSE